MSATKGKPEETDASISSLLKALEINVTPIYPSPPASPSPARLEPSETLKDGPGSSLTVSLRITPIPPISTNRKQPKLTQPADVKTQLTALTLTNLLGLDEWQCGSLKANGEPCRLRISNEKKKKIKPKIDSMIALTLSSPELEAKLAELTMLVHCYLHIHEHPKDSRIVAWMAFFPAGNDVVSVGRQIRQIFGGLSAQCIEIPPKGKRCNYAIGGQMVENCKKTIGEILKPDVYNDDACLDWLLEVLNANMYCPTHVAMRSLENVTLWKSRILKIRKQLDLESVEPATEKQRLERTETHTLASPTQNSPCLSSETSANLITDLQGLLTPRILRLSSSEFNGDATTFWPKTYDTTSFKIFKGHTLENHQSSYNLIRKKMKLPLKAIDQEDGYVYLYEVEGNKGYVKIGYTLRSTKVRHEEWSFNCNRHAIELYPRSCPAVTIPNACRVEALCHAELNHRRIKIWCKGCLKQHNEWFETSPAEATAVIEKWSKWMKSCPYQDNKQDENEGQWRLKETEERRTDDMKQFMKELSVVDIPIVT